MHDDRHDLTDEQWARLKPFLPVERTGRQGRPWAPDRQVVNAILRRTRTGAPWRDLPAGYGSWQTVYRRHRTWSIDGTWEQVLRGLQRGSDAMILSGWSRSTPPVCGAHQHAAGAAKAAIDVAAERLAVAFADDVEVDEPAGAATGGTIELQETAA